jgi:ribonuclease Y
MELNVVTLLLAIGNLIVGLAIGVLLRKKLVEGNQKNIALQGRQIIENSISEAEQIKKEALLQAKEEAFLIKQPAAWKSRRTSVG